MPGRCGQADKPDAESMVGEAVCPGLPDHKIHRPVPVASAAAGYWLARPASLAHAARQDDFRVGLTSAGILKVQGEAIFDLIQRQLRQTFGNLGHDVGKHLLVQRLAQVAKNVRGSDQHKFIVA